MQKHSQPRAEPGSAQLNRLLGALPEEDFNLVAEHLEPITLRLGDALYEPGRPLHHALFPTTSIASLHYVTADGAMAEFAAVGNDGMVGLPLFMGGNTTASSARVLVAGSAYRLSAEHLGHAFQRSDALRSLLLRYAHSVVEQITQTAVCNRHHSVEQQFCRWLLSVLDRLPSDNLMMTQELISQALGVRRETITAVAARLQHSGVIRYRRGHISMVDRFGLEHLACECYAAVRLEPSPTRLRQRQPSAQEPPPILQRQQVGAPSLETLAAPAASAASRSRKVPAVNSPEN